MGIDRAWREAAWDEAGMRGMRNSDTMSVCGHKDVRVNMRPHLQHLQVAADGHVQVARHVLESGLRARTRKVKQAAG